MKIIGVLPIKLNNERIKDKNLQVIMGKPLVTLMLEKLIRLEELDEVYCYCSSPVIQEYLPNGVKWFQRHVKYDSNSMTGNQLFEGVGQDISADIYVICSATAPFLKSSTIQKCMDKHFMNDCDSVCTVLPINGRLWQNGKPILTHDGWTCPRSQDIDPVYVESEGCWVIDSYLLKKYGRRIGFRPIFTPVSQLEAIDINTQEDLDFAKIIEKGLQ